LTIALCVVVAYALAIMIRFILAGPHPGWSIPFYDPKTFSLGLVSTGTSIAALTYIGFDSISTLSEEARNPKRDILRATVATCLLAGIIAAIEVYVAQLVWPDFHSYPDLDTAYSFVAGRAGGPILFNIVNGSLLVATIGSGIGSQLGAARLLYGMGRDGALPARLFAYVNARTNIPIWNVLFSGGVALIGALLISYQLGAELLNFGAFLAFTAVNASAFVHYAVRRRERNWTYIVLPILGAAVCLYIWSSLRWQAKLAGVVWLMIGAVYALARRKNRGAREAGMETDERTF
jgi:amino acid transporter